jgi:hypothetical protein
MNLKTESINQSSLGSSANYCTFMGLPSSCKTSFIGAFWHVVESGEIDSIYTVNVPPGDREYLNQLRKNFLDCEAPERTKADFIKKIELEIIERSTGKVATFIFPDLSGETFESQFEYRKMTTDYVKHLSTCNSLMLFINPSNIRRSFLISTLNGMLDNSESGVDQETPTAETTSFTRPWIPKMCQTQVIIVDLLQMVRQKVNIPFKIGVIISAWDIIKRSSDPIEAAMTPEQWLKSKLPLFSQFLQSNQATLPFKVFGISAQGGEYKDGNNFELQSKMYPSERLIVQSGDTINHDITKPLKWLFDE